MDLKEAKNQIAAQVTKLTDAAMYSTDICTVAKTIAVKDLRVQEKLAEKLAEGNVFRSIYCLKQPSIPENVHVVFEFDCPPDVFCLIDPSFMVVVNMITKKVPEDGIVDPYLPSDFTIANNTGSCNSCSSEMHVLTTYYGCCNSHIGGWTGPDRSTHAAAKKDVDSHNKNQHGGTKYAEVCQM